MAEIIQFGDKRKEASNNAQGAAALAFKTQTIDDWGNQELADLYRVKRLLEQAGVHVETDRGVTDEGDPWFVFCHPDGEVFVHLCRFDGQYLLDSTAIEHPLRGTTFTDLINQFVDRAIERRAANIVSLRPGDGVYLHPAIMLTALIWTLFVASDELIGIAHGAEIDAAGPDFDSLVGAHINDVNDTHGAFGILQAALVEQGDDPVAPKASELEKPIHEAADRELIAQSAGSAQTNAISLSLSAIAVTFGLTSKASFEFLQNKTAVNDDNTEAVVGPLSTAQNELQFDVESTDSTFGSDAGLENTGADSNEQELTTAENAQQLNAVFDVPQGIMLSLIGIKGVSTDQADILKAPTAEDIQSFISNVSFRAKLAGATTTEPASVQKDNKAEDVADASAPSTQIGAAFAFVEELDLQAYTLDEHEVFASFDLSKALEQGWLSTVFGERDVDVVTTPDSTSPITSGTIRATTVTEYSETAINFVKYLMSKSDTVELIALKGKIVLVDLSAFDEVSDVSYLRNWVHEDVGIISTIGHLSDFEAFGLVVA